ncbi:Oidioi.mRNA.OKI2018_I69.chr1.g106.t2.cds [Oikopleura dioica]|uniref:Oidioi.mRNA.OKI2018_I69.chr1.g106.t2.cds n=1 Tax=Oikopleura dioica TaxID=34765 RepID=A0ABN7ST43_OIKDI|nr:Oidioi.mRNA.OKI2018_I69.chr1.g106.t2.cds [Oikopleura dioica]
MEEKRILCVGLTCLDIVTEVAGFPKEDTDQRSAGMSWRRGGNASNNCTTLRNLQKSCEFFGAMSSLDNDVASKFAEQDLSSLEIAFENCVRFPHPLPSSIILLNNENGTRTIVHHRGGMPEITTEDFKKLDLTKYKWIHFEGRTKSGERPDVSEMIAHALQERKKNPALDFKVSVELEKTYEGVEGLGTEADVVFVSKEFTGKFGCESGDEMVKKFREKIVKDAMLICPWGDKGAFASDAHGTYSSPVFSPEKVVDTIGAGDSFVGATIAKLSEGMSLKDTIEFSCKYAGAKCGIMGLKDVPFPK